MIWHDGVFIDLWARIMCGQFGSHGLRHPPQIVQNHFPITNITKQACAFMRTDGSEICTGMRIVVSLQSHGLLMVTADYSPLRFFALFGAGFSSCLATFSNSASMTRGWASSEAW